MLASLCTSPAHVLCVQAAAAAQSSRDRAEAQAAAWKAESRSLREKLTASEKVHDRITAGTAASRDQALPCTAMCMPLRYHRLACTWLGHSTTNDYFIAGIHYTGSV